MRNYEAIEYVLGLFESGRYRYEDGKVYNHKGTEVKGTRAGKGKYLAFSIHVEGKRVHPSFHTVIYALFNGIEELKKHETIDHVDGDKYNNRPENLEGCTVMENNRRWYKRYYDSETVPF